MPKEQNPTKPTLTPTDIQGWVGDSSYKKGLAYYQDGAIFNTRRQGDILKAHSRGSSEAYYLVEVTLHNERPYYADCSCPMGGRCKHTAALLLTWVNEPESFQLIEELQTSLEKRSKEELIALIKQMLKRVPELDSLLEIPLPGAKSKVKRLDPAVIRKQVNHAFNNGAENDWSNPAGIVHELDVLINLASQYQAAEEYSQAATVLQQILDVAQDYTEIISSDEGDSMSFTLGECVTNLGECLKNIENIGEREDLLETLLDFFILDLKEGGIGLADEVPLILNEQAKLEEREILVKQLRRKGVGLSEWAHPILGGLELNLLGDKVDDETFLQICRETGRIEDLVSRLLTLNRGEEAVEATRAAAGHYRLRLADLLVQHGLAHQAELLVKEQLAQDSRTLGHREWLLKLYEQQQRFPEALSVAQEIFWISTSVSNYQKNQQLAETLACWPTLRAEILTRMEREGNFGSLTRIYLFEQEIDLALQTLERAQKTKQAFYDNSLRMEVAQAARKDRPNEAILLYLKEAEGLIHARDRKNYAAAAILLKEVKALYLKINQAPKWQLEISALRERHRSLPALKDELNKAGL